MIKSLEPELKNIYKNVETNIKNTDNEINANIIAKDVIKTPNVNNALKNYVNYEFIMDTKAKDIIKTILPKDSVIDLESSENKEIVKFKFNVSSTIKSPKEFFNFINKLNIQNHSINIEYPISMKSLGDILKVDYVIQFNQIN